MPCPRTQRHFRRPGIEPPTFRLLAWFPYRSATWLPDSPTHNINSEYTYKGRNRKVPHSCSSATSISSVTYRNNLFDSPLYPWPLTHLDACMERYYWRSILKKRELERWDCDCRLICSFCFFLFVPLIRWAFTAEEEGESSALYSLVLVLYSQLKDCPERTRTFLSVLRWFRIRLKANIWIGRVGLKSTLFK